MIVRKLFVKMKTWIALFRGINVGGKNILKMADLKKDLESLNLKKVRTYIQSGNVVFESSAKAASTVGKKISKRLVEQHGFAPQLLILSVDQLKNAIQSNPFPQAVSEPKLLHFFFLASASKQPDLDGVKSIQNPSEKFKLIDEVFYLFTPDGFHRSKLASKVEKLLGVVATARNYRTVEKLMSMVEER